MTDNHHDRGDPTGAGHLALEVLSALVDGVDPGPDVDEAAARAHLAGCPGCRDRFDELRAVAVAVGAPPPPPSAAGRDGAIAAAIAAYEDDLGEGGSEPGAAAPGVASAPSDALGRRRAARRLAGTAPRRGMGGWLSAVAAAIVVVVALAGLGTRDGDESATGDARTEALEESVPDESAATGSGDAGDTFAGGGAVGGQATDDGAASERSTAMASPAAPVHLGDLGALDDPAALAAAVEPHLRPTADEPAGDGAASGGAEAARPPDAGASASAPPGGSGDSDGAPTTVSGGAAEERPASASCEAAVREADPELGALQAVATGTVGGEPVEVLAFMLPGEGEPRFRVHVVRPRSCEQIRFQDL